MGEALGEFLMAGEGIGGWGCVCDLAQGLTEAFHGVHEVLVHFPQG